MFIVKCSDCGQWLERRPRSHKRFCDACGEKRKQLQGRSPRKKGNSIREKDLPIETIEALRTRDHAYLEREAHT